MEPQLGTAPLLRGLGLTLLSGCLADRRSVHTCIGGAFSQKSVLLESLADHILQRVMARSRGRRVLLALGRLEVEAAEVLGAQRLVLPERLVLRERRWPAFAARRKWTGRTPGHRRFALLGGQVAN